MSMVMKMLPVEQTIGMVLCHDMTQITETEKTVRFRKGQGIKKEDIPILLSMGKEQIYVGELPAGTLHEDDAAEILAAICRGKNIDRRGPREGKIELFAQTSGVFEYDADVLTRINAIEDLAIVARHNHTPVATGEKLAGMKVVPLAVEEEKLRRAEKLAAGAPVMNVFPYILKSVAVIVTGSEVAKGRIADAFTPVLAKKLAAYGISVSWHTLVPDGIDNIMGAIARARASAPDLIICTGGMSVDPDDNTPGAIRQSGASIVTYGAPVMPGVMFLLGYFDEGIPIAGLPAGAMYAGATIFDLVLPRIAAGLRLSRRDFTGMGVGGLCLSCPQCRYPICPFGRGM
ncbi:MAG: molybdopterin-binding protein [Treponema sp.]|jgi:molybdopterin biosynthesis enzyme|nr:molybdopterin-binding protein [Treponema sp.]